MAIVDFRDFDKDEEEIAQLLKEHWEISWSRVDAFKGKQYPFLFVRPDKKSREFFNIQKELVLLFLRSSNFEERDLDFFDKTFQVYSNRIDDRILIIVSRDEKIEDKIETYLRKQTFSRLIVPYNYDELIESKRDVGLQKKLEKIYYKKDLFSFQNPLQSDAFFFGRTDILKEIIGEYDLSKSVGLFGLRKLGKSSVLHSVRRQLNARQKFSVYLNFENPSLQQKKWFEILQFISDEIGNTLEKRAGIKFNNDQFNDYTEKNAADEFKQDLELYNSRTKDKVLLCFDEIERISPKTATLDHWKNGTDTVFFWQTLRSIIQEGSNLISLLIAGTNPLLFESPFIEVSPTERVDNPVYRFITQKYLDFFTREDVEKMILVLGTFAGLYFERDVFTYLFDDYGGHPFLTRMACSELNTIVSEQKSKRPFLITPDFYKDHRSRIENAVSDYTKLLVGVLQEWYLSEYQMLENLAVGNEPAFNQIVSDDSSAIKHLIGYRIVKFSNNRYRFPIESVRSYLIRKSSIVAENLGIGDRWKILVVERGNVERELRKLVREKSKLLYGKKAAADKLLAVLETPKRELLKNLSIDDLLADDTKHIYFSQLRTYISNNWKDFDKIFTDKPQFEHYMQVVNENRNDAHANTISSEELTKTISYCRWILKKIEEF